jgi:hypothetical protein
LPHHAESQQAAEAEQHQVVDPSHCGGGPL